MPRRLSESGPFGEGAELALEGAHVGVVDVAVGHVGDLVAHGVGAELVGHLGHGPDLGPPGPEQGDDLVLAHRLAERHPGQHLAHRAAGECHGDDRRRSRDRRRPAPATIAGWRARVRHEQTGGGTSPPEHHGWSRPSPSASEASSTGKRMARSSHRSGSRANSG